MGKFKFGPVQKLWLEQLKKYPERQTRGILGVGNPRNYEACCLGELLLCKYRVAKKKLPFSEMGCIVEEGRYGSGSILHRSFDSVGLTDKKGTIRFSKIPDEADLHYSSLNKLSNTGNVRNHKSLTVLNDLGMSWPDIADFVERFPEAVFIKSV